MFKPTKRQTLSSRLAYKKKNQSCYTSFHYKCVILSQIIRKWIKMSEGAFIFSILYAFIKILHQAQANRLVLV